jgi:hypothetical protein
VLVWLKKVPDDEGVRNVGSRHVELDILLKSTCRVIEEGNFFLVGRGVHIQMHIIARAYVRDACCSGRYKV